MADAIVEASHAEELKFTSVGQNFIHFFNFLKTSMLIIAGMNGTEVQYHILFNGLLRIVTWEKKLQIHYLLTRQIVPITSNMCKSFFCGGH